MNNGEHNEIVDAPLAVGDRRPLSIANNNSD
jgi:hypothetical protein